MARQAREMQEQAQAVLDNESKELILVGHTYVIAGEAGQIYRQYTNSDHGIDGEIEFKKDEGRGRIDSLLPPAQVGGFVPDDPKRREGDLHDQETSVTSNTGECESTR